MKTAPPADQPKVTDQVIAQRYAVTSRAVRKWAAEGRIPCIRIGKSLRFDLAAVIEAVEGKKP